MAYVERTAALAEAPVALIIGAGGLGMSIARALGKRHPLVLVDINQQHLDAQIASLVWEGYVAKGHVADITDAAQVKALAEAVAKPGVKALAHVAAVGKSIGDWRKMIDVDLLSAQHIANAVGPHMVRGGAALFISSLSSYLPRVDKKLDELLADPLAPSFCDDLAAFHGSEPDFDWAYSYAKLGINVLAERMARAWGEREVRSLSLSPGMIDSPMARAEGETLPAHDGSGERKTRSDKAAEIPLGRQGRVTEITTVVDFLLSDGASFINGIDIPVDGGHRAWWRANGITQR